MNAKELAKAVSEISRKEALLYYFPEEIEKAVKEDRFVLFKEGEKVAAFVFWYFYNDWVEITTLYVSPEFRGKGYLRRLVDGAEKNLKNKTTKPFLFTQAPQVVHVAESLGFRYAPHSALPFKILLKIILHRAHPRRWFSYFKHAKNVLGIFKNKLYLLKNQPA